MNTILKKPIITEKAMQGTQKNYYTFLVDIAASKNQIREAVEKQFKVTVQNITTTIRAGKTKRVGKMRKEHAQSDSKKARIQLKSGQTIDMVATPLEEKK